jgi:RNA polymerase sigma factor (sigma-70 family)
VQNVRVTPTPTDPQPDAALVARCIAGDGAAWALLVRRYQRLIHAVALRIGLDAHGAADVLQTVFSRLLQHLPRLNEPERLQAWIVTTAKREALQQRKRGQRTVSMSRHDDESGDEPDFDATDEALLPDEAMDALQQQHALRGALARIDERCRGLLALLFDDPDEVPAYEVIALRLDMPVGSIGPTRARCLGKLRGMLEDGNEPGNPPAGVTQAPNPSRKT